MGPMGLQEGFINKSKGWNGLRGEWEDFVGESKGQGEPMGDSIVGTVYKESKKTLQVRVRNGIVRKESKRTL